MDHGDMDMGGGDMGGMNSTESDSMDHGGMMGGCKISMLLNYNTIDSCFISEDWRVTSTGMFAGSCIGVVCLAIFLELLRRAVKEWDRYIVRQHIEKYTSPSSSTSPASAIAHEDQESTVNKSGTKQGQIYLETGVRVPPFHPKLWQHGVRAVLHTAQFTVAYFIMLLAMYYNVYILVSIFLGILVGNLLLGYETLYPGSGQQGRAFEEEPTVCCG